MADDAILPSSGDPSDPENVRRVRELLLEMPQAHSVEELLELVVSRVAGFPGVAVVRIWLRHPGDRCTRCPMRDDCARVECLHAVNSRGSSLLDERTDYSAMDDPFARIPIAEDRMLVGRIAATCEPTVIPELDLDSRRLSDPAWLGLPGVERFVEWAQAEEIASYMGAPLVFRDHVWGVIGLFARTRFRDQGPEWLRVVADFAASALTSSSYAEQQEREKTDYRDQSQTLKRELLEIVAHGEILGNSPAVQNLVSQIELVAGTDASVVITGESGTGKELVAREIHRRSQRADEPMVRVNCASIPAELYESEFFGHVKGAFTGAIKDRPGRFEMAAGGTLFLDEVGEIPLELQAKLLRAIQEGQYERVGEDRTRTVDVRLVAATNRDLAKEVEAGRFRQDLYYRLNVFPIHVSPLRERKQDIVPLADHFLAQTCTRWNRTKPALTHANNRDLMAYDWPGNVRELQNAVERALISCRGDRLKFDLPIAGAFPMPADADDTEEELVVLTEQEMRRRERENILRALDATGWKVYGHDGAAELLGIKPTTLASRIKKLKLRRRRGHSEKR